MCPNSIAWALVRSRLILDDVMWSSSETEIQFNPKVLDNLQYQTMEDHFLMDLALCTQATETQPVVTQLEVHDVSQSTISCRLKRTDCAASVPTSQQFYRALILRLSSWPPNLLPHLAPPWGNMVTHPCFPLRFIGGRNTSQRITGVEEQAKSISRKVKLVSLSESVGAKEVSVSTLNVSPAEIRVWRAASLSNGKKGFHLSLNIT